MQPIDNRKSPGCSRLPVGRSLRVLLLCAALSLFGLPPLVFAQSYTWKSVVTPAGGTITGIVYSLAAQGLIYARTDMGGSYRWDNTNKVWIPLTDWLGDWNLYGVDSIAADPKNANNVYAAIGQSYSGTTGSIIASTNQGAAWTQYPIAVTIAGNNGGNNAGERLAVDPNLTSTLYFGTRYNGLWKSTNSAATWSRVASFPVNGDSGNGLSWVVIDPHGTSGSASATIYVGVEAVGSGNSNVYRSTDGGANWSVIPGGPTSMITVQGSLGSDGTLWMSYNDSTNYQTGQIWKLNTATLGWSNVSPSNGPGSGAGGYSGVCVDAQNAQHAMVTTIDWWGGPDKCFQTTNGGGAWNVIANTQNSWDSGPFPVYNNNGVTWTRFCGPYDGGAWYMNCMKIDPFNSNNAIYTTGGGLWSSANILASVQPAGVTWTFTDYGIEQTAVLFLNAASKAGTFFSALGDISGMRYTDITKPAPTNYCNPAFGNTFCLDFAENSPNNVARVGASNAVTSDTAFSTDNGQTWAPGTSAPPGYTTTQQLRTVAVAADGSRVIVCPNSGYGNPAYTSNRGGAWTTCNGLPSGSDLAADRTNATTIYATNGGTLYRSVDTGGNFTAVNSFTGSGVPRAVFGVAGEVWVATGNGLFRFTNGGSTAATIANVSSANSVGFGKAASGQTHPAVYLTGNVGGTYGFYRCDDGTGATWMRINDNNHQYGYGAWCGGDEAIYGRVYVGTNGRGVVYGDLVATTPIPTSTLTTTSTSTPTATLTFSSTATRTTTVTPSRTATSTPTSTSTLTKTSTPTSSVTGTATPTRTVTASATSTPSPTATPTSTRTYTPTSTPTQTPFNTSTYTPSLTTTASATASRTPTNTSTPTGTSSPSPTASGTRTSTPTSTPIPVNTNTYTPSSTSTASASATASRTPTNTPTPTGTSSPSPTASGTRTSTATPTPTFSASFTPTWSATGTAPPTSTFTVTSSPTSTSTMTDSWTSTSTATRTSTPPATSTETPSSTPTLSSTPTRSMTGTPPPTDTFTGTPTPTRTETSTPTTSATASPSPTVSETSTSTHTSTSSPTFSTTVTWTRTTTLTATATVTATPTPTATFSRTSTSTATSTVTATWTPTASLTATLSFTPSTTSSSTFTSTGTATSIRTGTATWTPTWSVTSTPTSSVTSTPSYTAIWTSTMTVTSTWTTTPTSIPVGDCGRIAVSVPYPNPAKVGKAVRFNLDGFCPTNVHWTVVTTAYRKVLEANLATRGTTTIVTWDLKDTKGRPVAPGLYFLVVRPEGQDQVIQALMVMP